MTDAERRHPLYVGEFVTTLGMLLPVLSGPTAAVFAVYALLQWRRALYEEAILRSTFADYDSYSRCTPRFVPRLGARPSATTAPAAKRSHA